MEVRKKFQYSNKFSCGQCGRSTEHMCEVNKLRLVLLWWNTKNVTGNLGLNFDVSDTSILSMFSLKGLKHPIAVIKLLRWTPEGGGPDRHLHETRQALFPTEIDGQCQGFAKKQRTVLLSNKSILCLEINFVICLQKA